MIAEILLDVSPSLHEVAHQHLGRGAGRTLARLKLSVPLKWKGDAGVLCRDDAPPRAFKHGNKGEVIVD
jgi:hypothetical protein